ncbi:MAG: tetratricopeptide repeat protein [Candidatus Aminicenantes bacterium]|nr:tetratricopeptide repeat protein [Candidatus Aminicenantes bacterium]
MKKAKQVAQPAVKQEPIPKESLSLPPQVKNEHEEINKSVDNISNSLSAVSLNVTLLSAILTALGIILTLLTIAIAIVGALGFIEIRKWKKIRKRIEEDAQRIKDVRESLEKEKEEKQKAIPGIIKEVPSNELKQQVEELRRKIDILQGMGSKLTYNDYMSKFLDSYYKGFFNEAIESVDKALELKPDSPDAWYNKGVILSKLGKYEEALRAYDKALELKPDSPSAWYNKGVALSKHGKYEEALRAYDKAIELKPDDHSAWYNKACAYSLKKNKTEALKFLTKAIKLYSEYKENAKKDDDFKWLWGDPDFKAIVE